MSEALPPVGASTVFSLDTLLCIGDNCVRVGVRCGAMSEAKPDERAVQLDNFLAGVERRAYRMAFIATGNRDDALDLVQEAMFKLVEKYSDRGTDEWGGLFQRILQSKIRDGYRRNAVRSRVLVWLGGRGDERENEIEQFAASLAEQPAAQLDGKASMQSLDVALHALPLRQQQAFLLRAWEGLSTAQTASAMACSEGSVKTHYSRALHALREKLEDYRD